MVGLQRCLVAAVVVGSGVLAMAPSPAAAAVWPGVRPNVEQNAVWNSYGDEGGHWTGGDSTVSARLPDGRTAWLFSDTFLGAVNGDGTRPVDAPMIHNSMVIQDGAALTTIYGGTPEHPESLVGPTGPGTAEAPQYWVADAIVEGDSLLVFFNLFVPTGSGVLDFRAAGTAVATYALPSLARTDLRTLPLDAQISWGNALLADGDYTYIYGTQTVGGITYAHVARAPRGQLLGAWEFSSGAGWSSDEAATTSVLSGVGAGLTVAKVGDQIVLLTLGSEPFSPSLVAYEADSPSGPFGSAQAVYTAPEAGGPHIVYDPYIHDELTSGDELVVSYNVNSLDVGEVYSDAHLYRPRFLTVPWPLR